MLGWRRPDQVALTLTTCPAAASRSAGIDERNDILLAEMAHTITFLVPAMVRIWKFFFETGKRLSISLIKRRGNSSEYMPRPTKQNHRNVQEQHTQKNR